MKKIILIIIILLLLSSCIDKRKSPIETTKLFIENISNKNIKKIHELITPKDSKSLKKNNKNILRLNSQINKFHVKEIKIKKEEKINTTVELILESGQVEIINLKKIKDKYYVDLEL